MSTAPRAPLSLTPPDEALAALLRLLRPVAPRRMPAAEAVGHVLAEPILAARPVPATLVALREGWAVRAEETLGAGPYAPVPLALAPARVAPGDPLPEGSDAVLDPFEVEDGPVPQVLRPVAPGEGVRQPGEDIPAGACLRGAGERLAARDLPALAALGIAEVALRVPHLGLLGPASPFLAALAGAEGAGVAPAPGAAADLLVITSAGPAWPGLAASVQGLGARPGAMTGVGTLGGAPALLLPAGAEDAYAAWLLLLRPALRHLSGAPQPAPRRARLARKVASTVGLAEIVPLRCRDGLAEPLAVGALPLWAIPAADGVLVVPPAAEGYEAGAEISVLPP
jgi:molybdopterin molybdotransferase